jgi:hypothetical protein
MIAALDFENAGILVICFGQGKGFELKVDTGRGKGRHCCSTAFASVFVYQDQ